MPELSNSMSRWLFNIFKEERLQKLLSNLCQYLDKLTVRKNEVFLYVQRESPVFQCVYFAFGLVIGHHGKEPVSVLSVPMSYSYGYTLMRSP